jgi:hypothetical protein
VLISGAAFSVFSFYLIYKSLKIQRRGFFLTAAILTVLTAASAEELYRMLWKAMITFSSLPNLTVEAALCFEIKSISARCSELEEPYLTAYQ